MPDWLSKLLPIVLLLVAIAVVMTRLPKVDLGHSAAFKTRRFFNWFPLGLTYAFLYFGRYNLSANASALDKLGLLTKQEFGRVDGWGSAIYGIAFLLNGPLADLWGGRRTILISAAGSAAMNLLLGLMLAKAADGSIDHGQMVTWMTVLFTLNMYFQSFGAVSIVKVNAPWFHVRERGMLGGTFGILISLGLYFAYDWTRLIFNSIGPTWAFYVPAMVLAGFALFDFFVIRDTPSQAGHPDFDTLDASSGAQSATLWEIAKRILSQKVIWIIVAIEFCSGFLRNAVMKWYLIYADKIGEGKAFIASNWGVVLCVAGILGGVFAGVISDKVFDSRRGPVASVLYAGITVGAIVTLFALGSPVAGWAVVGMSLCVIGVHGMLSGTASADFGGRKGAGIATGIIDGFVYFGSAAQSFLYAAITPSGEAAKDPASWSPWPVAMIPVAIVGLALATRVWNAKPKAAAAPAVASPEPAARPAA
jgi:OPA family glycerol-3-phosphate transporter-like MFS transporter